jgi:putative transposase
MIAITSPFRPAPVSLATVRRVWGVSRATLYRHRPAPAGNEPRPPGRRGPGGAGGDAGLLAVIREGIEASPVTEGDRKVWARLRFRGVRTAARRARRIMKAHDLLAPRRQAPRAAHPHDGTIVTERVDETWGSDMTETVTIADGRAYVFIAVDHRSGECVGTHAASGASRWEALEPIRQGVAKHFGLLDAGAAAGLALRHDHGSNSMSHDLQREIRFLGASWTAAITLSF